MNRTLLKTFVALALLLSISEVASGGTVRIITLLDGAATEAMLGEVSQSIDAGSGICTVTVAPAPAYSVKGITVRKVTDAGNAQSRRNTPGVSVPIEVEAGDVDNTWLFSMPSEEFDVEVRVNFTVLVTEYYPVWVMGKQVTNINKDNVLGDGTVRFNPTTSTLSLYWATVGGVEDTDTIFSTSLPSLTVDLHGNNTIRFGLAGFTSRNKASTASLTFVTSDDEPGQLNWKTTGGVLADGFDVTYESPLRLFASDKLISSTGIVDYGLKVGDIVVNSVNCLDVLENGMVRYIDDGHVLVLRNAHLVDQPITCSLDGGLTIYLIGTSTIKGADNLITTSVDNAMIVFSTADNAPGSLSLIKTNDNGMWITGFAFASVPDDYATTANDTMLTIARSVPISPIVSETEGGELPEAEIQTEGFGDATAGMEPEDYVSVVVNNVLHTLKAGDYNPGTPGDPNDPAGVNLTESPTDMEEVLAKIPGSDAFGSVFKGLTFEVPAGNGQVMVQGEIGANAKLAVQVGDNAPFIFPNDDYPNYNELETIYIPYSCTEPTYVYVFLAAVESGARADSPFRGRVLTGHVKITTVGASSSVIVGGNSYSDQTNTIDDRVIAYSVPSDATLDCGIVMSTVPVGGIGSYTGPVYGAARREQEQAPQLKKITELGANVFDSVDKDKMLYVDLSGTDLRNMTVNRSFGLFGGFGKNALFYMPADNDDGGETNVIVGDNCARLNLTDESDFRAHKGFTASNVGLERTFEAGKPATVLLPFALSKTQADALGTFHTFKEVKEANAVFNEAESNGTSANKPYIFVPTATKIEAQDVSIERHEAFQASSGNLVGTFKKMIWDADQTRVYTFAATDNGDVATGQFMRVAAGEWLSPFSAYIQVSNNPNSSLNLVIGDNPTSHVSSPTAPAVQGDLQSSWYTVSGQRLVGKPSTKGLYINNGKVVVQ